MGCCLLANGSPLVPAYGRDGSNRSSTPNQLDNQNNQRNDQQDMDVPRNHVKSYEADQPKYKQNQENCPKHCVFSPYHKSLATL
jgi:hypothetical protein